MDAKTIYQNLARINREEGSLSAINCAFRRAVIRFREWQYGIVTERIVYLRELGLNNVDCNEYSPSDYDDFKILIASINIKAGHDVFLDFGAGLGRAVVLAATHRFRRVVGIELSEQLSALAEENIRQASVSFRCSRVEIVTCDATLYDVPHDATVIYFNNPFFGDVLESVLANIHCSLVARPRAISLICNLPSQCPFDSQIRRQGWLNLERELALNNGRRGMIFRARLDELV